MHVILKFSSSPLKREQKETDEIKFSNVLFSTIYPKCYFNI